MIKKEKLINISYRKQRWKDKRDSLIINCLQDILMYN